MNIKKMLLVIFIAFFIEIGIINFSNVVIFFDNTVNKNISYDINNMKIINWQKDSEKLISNSDPMLVVNNIDTNIKRIKIEVDVDKEIPYIDIFYTNSNNENFNGQKLVHFNKKVKEKTNIEVNQYVKDLRVDLGDDVGLVLRNIKIIINPTELDFSASRIIAIILIYYSTIALLSLQKAPYYKIKEEK